jgi:hypothetical protein
MHPEYVLALERLRQLSAAFTAGRLPFEPFYGDFGAEAHRLFDLDRARLPEALRREVEFYLRWEGFGPHAGHVPHDASWQYGGSSEPYGWIDKQGFRRRFAAEFAALALERRAF